MVRYATLFFVLALVAAFFGFGGIACFAVGTAKLVFVLFAVLAVASFLFGSVQKA